MENIVHSAFRLEGHRNTKRFADNRQLTVSQVCRQNRTAKERSSMHHLEARMKIVTPCFLEGTSRQAELRIPSVKGVLRFWWRALAYSQLSRKPKAVESLRTNEEELFGSTNTGQSRLLLSLVPAKKPNFIQAERRLQDNRNPVGPGSRYLGYGLMTAFGKQSGKLHRACLNPPCEFTLRIGAKNRHDLEKILPALKLFGLVGGLGSRNRKGYGSVNLLEISGDINAKWKPPRDAKAYETQLVRLLNRAQSCETEPPFSAFSALSRLDLALPKEPTAMNALEKYGREMVRYRSWGKSGKILDGKEQSERNFNLDHDWSKTKRPDPRHPQRAIFGLPHNYQSFKGEKIGVKPVSYDRRASPLFYHVHQLPDGYIGIAFILRSAFLPPNEQILARNQKVDSQPNWDKLTSFLDRFQNRYHGRTLWPPKS